jgi:hypothetical protein
MVMTNWVGGRCVGKKKKRHGAGWEKFGGLSAGEANYKTDFVLKKKKKKKNKYIAQSPRCGPWGPRPARRRRWP